MRGFDRQSESFGRDWLYALEFRPNRWDAQWRIASVSVSESTSGRFNGLSAQNAVRKALDERVDFEPEWCADLLARVLSVGGSGGFAERLGGLWAGPHVYGDLAFASAQHGPQK